MTLDQLGKRIESELAKAERRRDAKRTELAEDMARLEELRAEFKATARRIGGELLAPRMTQLAKYFDHSTLSLSEDGTHASCRFEHTDRFPASTRLDIALIHDLQDSELSVSYRLEILPVFMDYERRAFISFPLTNVDEAALTQWLDDRLVQFVETYLCLETHEGYHRRDRVRDPVCGMELSKANAVASTKYRRRTFYFCVEACRDKFCEDPARFVTIPA